MCSLQSANLSWSNSSASNIDYDRFYQISAFKLYRKKVSAMKSWPAVYLYKKNAKQLVDMRTEKSKILQTTNI
jgi:hypothetical protein